MDNAKGSCINFPCYVRVDINGTPYLTVELAFALSVASSSAFAASERS